MARINKRKQRIPCTICGATKSKLERCKKNGVYYEHWRKLKGQVVCNTCWRREYYTKIRNKKWNPIYTSRTFSFKNNRKIVKEKPRKGQCDWCGKKIGDEFMNYRKKLVMVQRTSIHHIEYYDNDFLKGTVELCNSCHTKETWRLNQLNGNMIKGHRKKKIILTDISHKQIQLDSFLP